MINGIYSAEFDLVKGCVITGKYPKDNDNVKETMLSSYMIPDGVHKIKQDYFFFKMPVEYEVSQEEIDEIFQQAYVRIFVFEQSLDTWNQIQDQDFIYKVQINRKDRSIEFYKDKELVLNFRLSNCTSSIISNNLLCIDCSSTKFGLQFCKPNRKIMLFLHNSIQYIGDKIQQFYYFFCILQNKRDLTIKRGSLIRSIAISSIQNQFLQISFTQLESYLQKYFELIGVEHWNDVNAVDLNKLKVQQLLRNAFEAIDKNLQNSQEQLEMPFNVLLNNHYLFQQHHYLMKDSDSLKLISVIIFLRNSQKQNFSKQPSLINLFNLFGAKTQIIYRALINQQKILFIAHDSTNSKEDNKQFLYSGACDLACSCANLVFPINIFPRIQGYQGISDLRWVETQGYVCVVSNPFFEQRKDWFDLGCDIVTGQLIESFQVPNIIYDSQSSDNEFFTKVFPLKQIYKVNNMVQEQLIDEKALKKLLCKYTLSQIKKLNLYNQIPNLKYFLAQEKLQSAQIFGAQRSFQIAKSICLFENQKEITEINLILIYNTILSNIDNEEKLKEYLKIYLKSQTPDQLLSGLFSTNQLVVQKCLETIALFNKFQTGQYFLNQINYMYLKMIQFMKNTKRVDKQNN